MPCNPKRIRTIKNGQPGAGPVVYWMSRDQRAEDNWALLYARELAEKERCGLVVVFCLSPHFLGATRRQYGFMIKGIEEVGLDLQKVHIPFTIILGEPGEAIGTFVKKYRASALVTDFSPLRIKKEWMRRVAKKVDCSIYEVDAHNVVPCFVASSKREYGAYTLRPKIHKLLSDFLVPFPVLKPPTTPCKEKFAPVAWKKILGSVSVDETVPEVGWVAPGRKSAERALAHFVAKGLPSYDADRNDPNLAGQSNLSPYLHFGQIAPGRAALAVHKSSAPVVSKNAFLEELIVRRELADNFCEYTPDYDAVTCFPDWAKKTLAEHGRDKREYVYSKKEFETGKTHDKLWNAAQMEMVKTGKMHGYLRMYWAKKILEWTATPEAAMKIAIYLNDRYELDGRDPNGYAGIAWSIGGVHDRPWFDRPIFGKIRFMSASGSASKFDVEGYIDKVDRL